MKSKVIFFHGSLGALALVFCITSIVRQEWFNTILSIATVGSVYFIYRLWMKYIAEAVLSSRFLLNNNKENVSSWSLENLSALVVNHQKLDQKLKLSAEHIKRLSVADGTSEVDQLLENDPIGEAISSIREDMKRLRVDEDRRSWISNGLAKFGEILSNKSELKEYTYQIISNLVKYLEANQGALFIENVDEEGRHLELSACYAYAKRKYMEARIAEGQGLLGQCMLEKDFIFITDIPKDYIKITSGLGEATPRNVVVAPLIFKDSFQGVIELALFNVMQPHQMEFLKKVCESIASEIASIKNIERTQKLLDQSNVLTHELQANEEEMKQNLEELAATQEEMARKQMELTGIFEALNVTLATAELSVNGSIINCNSRLLDIFKTTNEQIKECDYALLTGNNVQWKDILSNEITAGDFETLTESGKHLWLSISFTGLRNQLNEVTKILCLIQDITQRKDKEIEFERLSLVANNTDNSVIITDRDGITQYVNSGFTKMTSYKPHEVIGKKPGAVLQGPLTDQNTILKIREGLKKHQPINEEILNYRRDGQTYWVSLAINPVYDQKGEVKQFISIQADITATKLKALDFHQKMEALGKSNSILELSPSGEIIDINDNYLNLLGYSREDLIGKSYDIITHRNHVFDKLMSSIRTEGVQRGEFTRFDKQGKKHTMRLMDYPVTDFHGELVKIIEFGTDVTLEKELAFQAEQKNAELNSYLSAINNTIASAEFSLRGDFLNGNDIFLKVLGYSMDDLKSENYQSLLSDVEAANLMWESLTKGKFFSGEFKITDSHGKYSWLTGTFSPIVGLNGAIEKIAMLAQFTTQEKEKFNDLNVMVNALKATLPVLEFNENFECRSGNEKALKLFDISRLQVRSKNILSFIDPYFHRLWKDIREEICNAESLSVKLPVITASSGQHTYEVGVTVSRDLEGKIKRIIFLFVKEIEERVPVLAVV